MGLGPPKLKPRDDRKPCRANCAAFCLIQNFIGQFMTRICLFGRPFYFRPTAGVVKPRTRCWFQALKTNTETLKLSTMQDLY